MFVQGWISSKGLRWISILWLEINEAIVSVRWKWDLGRLKRWKDLCSADWSEVISAFHVFIVYQSYCTESSPSISSFTWGQCFNDAGNHKRGHTSSTTQIQHLQYMLATSSGDTWWETPTSGPHTVRTRAVFSVTHKPLSTQSCCVYLLNCFLVAFHRQASGRGWWIEAGIGEA